MERKILKCISTIEEFDLECFKDLDIGVEIQDFTEPNLSNDDIEKLILEYSQLFKDFKGIKALHGPFLDLSPSSPDIDIRRVSYRKYLRTIKAATRLQMDYIIFHSQINPYLNTQSLIDLNNQQCKEFWQEIMAESLDFKGIVLLENIFEETPELLKERVEKIELPNVKIILDVGHARLGSVSLEKWIKEFKDYLEYVHLHSNNGIHDQHQIPSDIELKALGSLFNKYNINPVISLEYKTKDPSREIEILRG